MYHHMSVLLCNEAEARRLTSVRFHARKRSSYDELGSRGSRAESSTHSPSPSASWYLSPVPGGPTSGQHHRRGFVPSIDSTFRRAPRF